MAIDLTNPQGRYGGSAQAVVKILEMWGAFERQRQDRQLTDAILQGTAAGKDMQGILADVMAAKQQMGSGLRGGLRQFSSNFMPQSQTEQMLQQLGLQQTDPRIKADLETQKARTDLAREQTETEKATRPVHLQSLQARLDLIRQQADQERRMEGLETRQAEQQLAQGEEQIKSLRDKNNPDYQTYEYNRRLAEMILKQLQSGDVLPGTPEYDQLTQDFNQTRQGMNESWQRYERRGQIPLAPPTEVNPQPAPAPQQMQPPSEGAVPPGVGMGAAAAGLGAAQAGAQPQAMPVPGLSDIWSRFDAEDQADLQKTYQQIRGDVNTLLAWKKRVRELVQ